MLVPELYVSHLAVQPQTGAAGVRAWTTGQILDATVVRQALDGTVTLRIGGQEVQARTGLTLSADQPITLQVAQSGVQTVLRVLHATNASVAPDAGAARTGTAPPELATLAHAWRQVLPRQGDALPLLTRLATLLPQPAAAGGTPPQGTLPAPVAQALQVLSTRLPALESLFTAAGLKRAIGDSGVFLEARLGQAAARSEPPAVANDFKANLLALVQTLRAAGAPPRATAHSPAETDAGPAAPTTAVVLKEADAALARVEQQQLTNLSRPADQPPALPVEVPLRDEANRGLLRTACRAGQTPARGRRTGDSVERDPRFRPGAARPAARAHRRARRRSVSATLWAEQPTTAELVAHHLDELGVALRAAGPTPTALSCQATRLPPAQAPAADPGTQIVDEHA
ncbi:MAG: hypothetical protein MZV65_54670 [Chromatiales bacterium]|nr:hypothetical protein [Chromatiales bacterium]